MRITSDRIDPSRDATLSVEENSTLEPQHRALVLLLAYGGLRIGEARALRRRNVNLQRGEVEVTQSVTKRGGGWAFTPPKNGRTRTVTLPHGVVVELEAHLSNYTSNDAEAFVFTERQGEPLGLENFRRRRWKPAVSQAGISSPVQIHHLRHTCASVLINQNVHPKMVQEHLGHGSIEITMNRYGHLYKTDSARISEALQAAFTTGLVTPATRTSAARAADKMQT